MCDIFLFNCQVKINNNSSGCHRDGIIWRFKVLYEGHNNNVLN